MIFSHFIYVYINAAIVSRLANNVLFFLICYLRYCKCIVTGASCHFDAILMNASDHDAIQTKVIGMYLTTIFPKGFNASGAGDFPLSFF